MGLLAMQADEVPTIEGQHRPTVRRGERQHFRVIYRLPRLTRFLNGQHVMP
jgi:hypothetical protein